MCGICGVYDYGRTQATFDESLLIRMSDAMHHRGPDDSGTYVSADRRLGFGFRRLSIIDLSPAGHQPMSTPDGKTTIVFNGEIYNHRVLRADLEPRGYRYRSRGDTESLLFAYREYGIPMFHRLLGMFAFAMWDEPRKVLYLVRDRIGVKPLYYYDHGGTLVFASEIKAILRHPSVHADVDEEALARYLTFLVSPAPKTMFRGIQKIPPGHYLEVGPNGTRCIKYWDASGGPDQPSIGLDGTPTTSSRYQALGSSSSEAEHTETIRTLLRQSIKDRMMSDVPFGVFLSGGIDSSTNVALMAEQMNRPVDTFTVGFKDLERYNELEEARVVARRFGTNHREILVDEGMAMEFLPAMVAHQDEPLADPVCIPLYFVSRLAKESGTTVVQVGEGSDELFGGYRSTIRDLRFYHRFWRRYASLPGSFRNFAFRGAGLLPLRGKSLLALDYLRRAAENEEYFWGSALHFTETHKRRLFLPPWNRSHPSGDIVRAWNADSGSGADLLRRMAYVELRHRLPELLLMRVDKMAMAASVEARVPFLDHRLVEYAMHVPMNMKVRGGTGKYILKKAVEKFLSREIVHRRKQGFDTPVNEWLRGPWAGFTESTLKNSFLVKSRMMSQETIESLIRRHRATADRQDSLLIWNLMNVSLWHSRWIP